MEENIKSTAKIYSRKGDDGTTSFDNYIRIGKDDPRIWVCGELDELSCVLGIVINTIGVSKNIAKILIDIQGDLSAICATIAKQQKNVLTAEHVTKLEDLIDKFTADLPLLNKFVALNNNVASAYSNFARAVCRRAERCAVVLHQQAELDSAILPYLNRLSDLLFTIAQVLGVVNK